MVYCDIWTYWFMELKILESFINIKSRISLMCHLLGNEGLNLLGQLFKKRLGNSFWNSPSDLLGTSPSMVITGHILFQPYFILSLALGDLSLY